MQESRESDPPITNLFIPRNPFGHILMSQRRAANLRLQSVACPLLHNSQVRRGEEGNYPPESSASSRSLLNLPRDDSCAGDVGQESISLKSIPPQPLVRMRATMRCLRGPAHLEFLLLGQSVFVVPVESSRPFRTKCNACSASARSDIEITKGMSCVFMTLRPAWLFWVHPGISD